MFDFLKKSFQLKINPLKKLNHGVLWLFKKTNWIINEDVNEEITLSAMAFEAQDGVAIVDKKRTIVRVNKSFCRITGYESYETAGKHITFTLQAANKENSYNAVVKSIKTNGFWKGELFLKKKNGSFYTAWMTVTPYKDGYGFVSHYVCTLIDISLRKKAEEQIYNLAYYDQLTAIPNRRMLIDNLEDALVNALFTCLSGAILFIDLDNFKDLNDTQGHKQGDRLLQLVSERLILNARPCDTVSRFGGDEFVILLENLSNDINVARSECKSIAGNLLLEIQKEYKIDNYTHICSCSIGATVFSGEYCNSAELLKQADMAMYQAKLNGGNTFCFFDIGMQQVVEERAAIECSLRNAVVDRKIDLFFQIQINSTGIPIGAEALARWFHPERGAISPSQFIPLAERSGLIIDLGNLVLEKSCLQIKEWESITGFSNLTISVNISPRQFHQENFVEQVLEIIKKTGANSNRLKLEITETVLLESAPKTVLKIMELKSYGIKFALDDFGTGYSSLSYLRNLPLDELKIDRSFLKEVDRNGYNLAIIQAIITLAKHLNLEVTAEGIESTWQKEVLSNIGCDNYQGYLYGIPLSAIEFEKSCERQFPTIFNVALMEEKLSSTANGIFEHE